MNQHHDNVIVVVVFALSFCTRRLGTGYWQFRVKGD